MHEAEFSKFSISLLGEDNNPRKRGDFSNLTFEKLCNWINRMEISDEVKKECILLLKKYPHSALKGFVNNFQNVHLRTAQANARKKIQSEQDSMELGEKNYVGSKNSGQIEPLIQEDESQDLPDLPKADQQTDFFPENK